MTTKKKIFIGLGIVTVLIILGLLIFIAFNLGKVSERELKEETSIESIEETEIELTELENSVYEVLIKNSSYFNNPSSLRLLDVVKIENEWYFKIQGTNKMGGTVNNYYKSNSLNLDDCEFEELPDESIQLVEISFSAKAKQSLGPTEDIEDMSSINKKLKEYWEDKGL